MRIIGGVYRHRTLEFISDEKTRPTKDRIREAIFSSLGVLVKGRHVLDLFAGSGSMGIEALSRGAVTATFVDIRKDATDLISRNIHALGVNETKVFNDDYRHFLNQNQDSFDLIFLDPPYAFSEFDKLIEMLLDGQVCRPDAIIILETQPAFVFTDYPLSGRHYQYGDIAVDILRRTA